MKYSVITEEEILKMEKEWMNDRNSIPKECFVAKLSNGNFLALDNSSGECWTEEFTSKVLVEEFFNDNLGYGSDYQEVESIRHHNNYYY